MARIPQGDIERLKEEISLVRLIQSQGHTLIKRGKDWVMCCVFHEETTASMVVSEDKNLYHCFGCNAGGSVLDWVMKTQSVSLPHAVQILRSGVALEGNRIGVEHSQLRHLPTLVTLDTSEEADEQLLLSQVVETYHVNLKQSPEALAYLETRGLVHSELIDTFKLGYSNGSLTYRLPVKYTQVGREIRGKLRKIGVYRESGYEHLNGCLVVPIIGIEESANVEHAGKIMQLYGRRIAANHKIGVNQSRHTYLSRPLQGVWNELALKVEKEIILCESLIDAMTFWCAGYRNVIAAYGVNGFTFDHWQAIKQHGTKRILIAYDRDDAGNIAADKLAIELLEAGIETYRVLFPKEMDANDYAKKVKPAEKSLGIALQQAQWLGKGKNAAVVVVSESGVNVEPELPPKRIATKEKILPEVETFMTDKTSSLAAPSERALPESSERDNALSDISIEQNVKGELILSLGDRRWRIRGWQKNLSPEQMRVNVQVWRESEVYYVDTFDVYSAKQRTSYIKQAGIELGMEEEIIKRDLGKVLLKLEALQDQAIQAVLSPQKILPKLSDREEEEALSFLKSPELIKRLVEDMERCGVVGESTNLLAGYLAAVSRKLDAPLAVLIQSSSAAGKSSLMEAVLNLMPDEERIQYSAMTGQSLFYLGETDLQHKILAIAEEEGVRQAAYALKLLQSDGELTIASTGKDEATGNLITKQYCVKGPVMLMLTTTAIDIDEELLNRCLVLTVNESREQTQAIHTRQRAKQTLEGLLMDNDRHRIMSLHQNAQRLIKSVHVVNPYANRLTFLDDKTRMRRDHMKYLTLIRAIALLHQYQRPMHSVEHRGERLEYIEVVQEDIVLANQIAHEVLGRTLDELPPQTRRLLHLIFEMVESTAKQQGIFIREVRFTRRDIREATSWSDGQLKIHCMRLTEMEYMLIHGGSRGHHLQYELLYDGMADKVSRLCGLIDPETLTNKVGKLGQEECKLGPSQGQVSPKLGPSQGEESQSNKGLEENTCEFHKNAHLAEKNKTISLAAVSNIVA